MRPVIVVGAGGHGKDVAAILTAAEPATSVMWIDDRPGFCGTPDDGHRFLFPWLVGVNDGCTRARLADRWGRRNPDPPMVAVHPAAVVGGDVQLAPGCVVAAGAVLTTDVVVGSHTHINVGASVSQGSTLGQFVTVGPGARICGDCTIGDFASIGAGAVIINCKTVGDHVTVGAGAVVIDSVLDGLTVVGVPAKALTRSAWSR